jgi:transposase-like protein
MARNRKSYDAKTKFNVVIELIQWRKTQAQITSEYGVHPTQQIKWKEEFLKNWSSIFKDKRSQESEDKDKKIALLERKVGQFAVEVDWLQKKIDQIPFL